MVLQLFKCNRILAGNPQQWHKYVFYIFFFVFSVFLIYFYFSLFLLQEYVSKSKAAAKDIAEKLKVDTLPSMVSDMAVWGPPQEDEELLALVEEPRNVGHKDGEVAMVQSRDVGETNTILKAIGARGDSSKIYIFQNSDLSNAVFH